MRARTLFLSWFGALLCLGSAAAQDAEPARVSVSSYRPAHVVEDRVVAGVPTLIVRPTEMRPGLRLVVLFHGFGPPADPWGLREAVGLADLEVMRAYVKLPMVPRRAAGKVAAPTDWDALKKLQREDFVNGFFFPTIRDAAAELKLVVDALAAEYHLDVGKGIGLFGFSAGGAAAMLALAESEVSIAAAVVVNAPMSVAQNVANWERTLNLTFKWDESSRRAADRYNVVARAAEVAKRPLRPAILLLQGAADRSFAPAPAQEAAAGLRAAYAGRGVVDCEILPDFPHNFGGDVLPESASWANARRIEKAAAHWFAEQMKEGG